MLKLALAGAIALALSSPVVAQECINGTLPEVIEILEGVNESHTLVPPADIPGFLLQMKPILDGNGISTEGVTNVLVATLGDLMVFGLEQDGCMSPPIPFAQRGPTA